MIDVEVFLLNFDILCLSSLVKFACFSRKSFSLHLRGVEAEDVVAVYDCSCSISHCDYKCDLLMSIL